MMTPGTQVTVGVPGHLLVGSLLLTGSRIQERLNDSREDAVPLSEVEVYSRAQRERIARLPAAVVPKSQIEYLLPATNDHEAPEKRWNNHTPKRRFNTFVILSDCSVFGKLHLKTDPSDAWYTLTQHLPRFFAITDATIRGIVGQLQVPLLIANKNFVSAFQVESSMDIRRASPDRSTSFTTVPPAVTTVLH